MKTICPPEQCTGCALCLTLCPKKCISFKEGKLGHLYPVVNEGDCIDCGLCRKKCPSLSVFEKEKPSKAFATWSKNEQIYSNSSSGGLATQISKCIIEQGGVVYGSAVLPDIVVRHIRVDNMEDISKLQGSKYVQSDIQETLRLIKTDIKRGVPTLFIGTPCQVAAVKNLFRDVPGNLFLIDLICHGVPSLNLLKRHIRKVADCPHYDNVRFREGNQYFLSISSGGKVVYHKTLRNPRYKEWYINTFFDGYVYRDSCYACHYSCPERISDMTIGDFWGLGRKASADMIPAHPKGCSVALPITDKGYKLLQSVSKDLNIYERTVDEAIEGNDQLQHPTILGKRKRLFRLLYPVFGRVSYKIAIIDKYTKYQLKRILGKLK